MSELQESMVQSSILGLGIFKMAPNRKVFANTFMIFLIENYELTVKTLRVEKFLKLLKERT